MHRETVSHYEYDNRHQRRHCVNPLENGNFGVVIAQYNDMRSFLLILVLSISATLGAQHTISGTFSPAEDYTWLIAYHLKPGAQDYVADGPIKEGKFELSFAENSPAGTYRLVYAIPQEEYNFDVFFTGKEDVALHFDSDKGLTFTASNENIVFNNYLSRIQEAEHRLISYYTSGSVEKDEFETIVEDLHTVQNSFVEKSANLNVSTFIKANRPYIPSEYETANQYVNNRKAHYFDALNLADPALQASGFLTEKLLNYVFTALPPEPMKPEESEALMMENLKTIIQKLEGVSNAYQFNLLYSIWSEASAKKLPLLSAYVYQDYLKSIASTPAHQELVAAIELEKRIQLGAMAPEIVWKKDGTLQSLSELEGYDNYVLVFWSSTCGHCLNELPALHKRLKKHTNVKVLAVGLEDDDKTWKTESAKLNNFDHAIALGKWDSEYALTYGINGTPTYFILDQEKRILAKPENDKGVVEFLEKAH